MKALKGFTLVGIIDTVRVLTVLKTVNMLELSVNVYVDPSHTHSESSFIDLLHLFVV